MRWKSERKGWWAMCVVWRLTIANAATAATSNYFWGAADLIIRRWIRRNANGRVLRDGYWILQCNMYLYNQSNVYSV